MTDLEVFGRLAESLERIVGLWMVALVRMDHQGQPPVALFDLVAGCIPRYTHDLVWIQWSI